MKSDPTQAHAGIFSRAVRTAIGAAGAAGAAGADSARVVLKKDEPQIQFESDSEIDEDSLLEESGIVATVANLPHGMTDTRLKTLAGTELQVIMILGLLYLDCLSYFLGLVVRMFGSRGREDGVLIKVKLNAY